MTQASKWAIHTANMKMCCVLFLQESEVDVQPGDVLECETCEDELKLDTDGWWTTIG